MPKLTITMTIPIPDLPDLDNPEYYWEEHMCIGDIIEDYILPLMEEADGRKSCICWHVDKLVYQNDTHSCQNGRHCDESHTSK